MPEQLPQLQKILKDPRFLALTELAQQGEAQVYVVGGAIRDVLLGVEPRDIDFVVRGMSARDLQDYLKQYGAVKKIGARFGVFHFVPKGKRGFEIAMPRTEKPSGRGGYRDVEVDSDPDLPIAKDLERRDFSINAMAFDIKEKKLIDNHGGAPDVESKLIQTVGDPKERFSEDLTRILRAVRLAVQLDFLIAVPVSDVMTSLAPRITSIVDGKRLVPDEVIGKELILALDADPLRTIYLLEDLDLLKHVLPEVEEMRGIEQYAEFHPEGDVLVHTKRMLENLPDDSSINLKLSVLLHDIGKARAVQVRDFDSGKRTPVKNPKEFFAKGEYDPMAHRIQNIGHDILGARMTEKLLNRLAAAQFEHDPKIQLGVDEIVYNVRHHLLMNIGEMKPHKAEHILFRADGTVRTDLVKLVGLDPMTGDKSRYNNALKRIKEISGAPNPFAEGVRAKKSLITGQDVLDAGLKPGPAVKSALDRVRDEQIAGNISTKAQALAFIKKTYVA